VGVLFAGEEQTIQGRPLTAFLRTTTDQFATESGLSDDQFFAFAEAIIAHESNWNARAYHFDGPDTVRNASYGLMQVEGVTAMGYGLSEALVAGGRLYDIPTNLAYGVRRLAEAVIRQPDLALAAADYNEGPGNVAKGLPDTSYVNDVLRKYQAYYTANTGAADPVVTAAPEQAGFASGGVLLWVVGLGLAGAILYAALRA
jgi:transglycosylase-like protein with SLT domain